MSSPYMPQLALISVISCAQGRNTPSPPPIIGFHSSSHKTKYKKMLPACSPIEYRLGKDNKPIVLIARTI